MPDSLSPVTMTEDYYAKIAGQDVTPPDPATREQKWLDAIAGRVDGLAEDVEDLGDIVPTPEAADSGKVLTAGADGTASWQTASGGDFVITGTYQNTSGGVIVNTFSCDKTAAECLTALQSGVRAVYYFRSLDDDGNVGYTERFPVTGFLYADSVLSITAMQQTVYFDNGDAYLSVSGNTLIQSGTEMTQGDVIDHFITLQVD